MLIELLPQFVFIVNPHLFEDYFAQLSKLKLQPKIQPHRSFSSFQKDKRDLDVKYQEAMNNSNVIQNDHSVVDRIEELMRVEGDEPDMMEVEDQPVISEMPDVEVLIQDRLKNISKEEEDAANKILSGPDNHQVVIEKFKIDMTRNKIKCLEPGAWLNDEVINFYMCMLQVRDEKLCTKYPSRVPSYFFNSFFITKLLICDHGYTYGNVKRWSKKFDIFAMDKIFFPVNLNNSHWAMAVVYMRKKRICYYDSMSCDGSIYLKGLMRWIKDEGTHKKGGMVVDESEWELSQKEPNVPQQRNGFDCGVFSTICADFISDDLPLRYSQIHMQQFRVKTAAAILRGEIIYTE
eukprot:gene6123-8439_t